MTAGAPYGNSNAEKYNEEKAEKLFNKAIELALTKEKNGAYTYDFIGEVARDLGTYHHVFRHLVTRFPKLTSKLTDLIQTLEANCYFNSKKGKIREATAIVNLKANHNWRDRQQIDHNLSGEVDIKPKKWR